MKTALITGVTGQDGSYMAEFLLEKGYIVHGIKRRSSSFNTARIDPIFKDIHSGYNQFFVHYGDMTDGATLRKILYMTQPDEIYNLAAQSHVGVSFLMPEYTADVDALGAIRLLEAVREYRDGSSKDVRYYQAGTSEMFGSTQPPQSETSPFHPRSPYAVAKIFAHWQTINYRESYGLFAANGILFNHESERRGETFVTRKITMAATRIKLGLQDKLFLGNLDAKRDWGHAIDFVRAMWLILQQDTPDDFVIATGESRSVRDFVTAVFERLDLDWKKYVEIDKRYFRPAEVEYLQGDPSKANRVLGWEPTISFDQLVDRMVKNDLSLAKNESLVIRHNAQHTDDK